MRDKSRRQARQEAQTVSRQAAAVDTAGEIGAAFAPRNADDWEQLGEELDIPIVKVIAVEGLA